MNSIANDIDTRIVKTIKRHHIFTLATSCGNEPYCCTCFYTYSENENIFIFTSEHETRHIAEALKQKRIAGAIALETKIIGKIRGVQFTGEIYELEGEELKKLRKIYLRRFPYVTPFIKDAPFWKIEPDFLKLTDNNIGFGKKLLWTRATEKQ
jgi:uncharacterized protein